jgi:HNH endonuclease
MDTKRRVPEALRQQVRERGRGRCEYCLVHEEDVGFTHQADHIIAEKHGGATSVDNLAWACMECNRYKGADLTSIDPTTGRLASLYHPRRQSWRRHFRINGPRLDPLTASGRATAFLLQLNDPMRMRERAGLIAVGRYPQE